MELGILVGHIKSELEKQKKLVIAPEVSQSEDLYDCSLEAQVTFNELDAVIKQLEAFDQKQEATVDNVKLITDFFEKRWERIKNTDLIYPINTEHLVTNLCVYIAQYLANQRDLVMKRNYLALLMPTISNWHNDVSHSDLWTLYLHNFLPDDSNKFCIQMGYVDLNMDKTNTRLEMSVKVGAERVFLSEQEADRIYHHSHVISDYYDLMKTAYQTQEEMKRAQKSPQEQQEVMKKQQGAISVARENMVKALRDERYGKRSVRSSYGKQGRLTLQNNLLKDPNNLFASREQVFHFMATRLDVNQWRSFLAKMNDNDKFMSLILQGSKIDDPANLNAMFKKDGKYNRAVAYCLVEAYSRMRLAEGEYTTVLAYIGSFISRVFPKEIKEKVVEIMRKYLTGEVEAGSDYSKYFFSGDMSAEKRAMFSDDEIDLLNAMKNSRVGKIHERICALLAPAVVVKESQQAMKMSAVN